RSLTLAYMGEDGAFRETVIELSPAPERIDTQADRSVARWHLELEPGAQVEILATIEPAIGGRRRPRRRVATATEELRAAEEQWRSRCTTIESDNERFNAVISRSAQDLRSLVMPAPGGRILAAGIPWYVAPFGRDALTAAGEALLLNTDLTADALGVLSGLQAQEDDEWRDAEPGKILHELRVGELAGAGLIPHTPYYGTVDATPLFLMRAADHYAWTGDLATMRTLRPSLDAALAWIDRYGDRDGDGFVEYERRSAHGLQNQSWKDSGDSQRFRDGTLAQTPIAPCEVQGYVYDAKLRTAELAREIWRDRPLAERLEQEAAELRRAFNERFWTEARGGYYVLALDGEKRQVDSLCSNIGHLLWSGIVPSERVDVVVDALMGEELWSGWGVRTMSTGDAGYNPLSYHNGTVWPHENSLLAQGLARHARWPEAQRIVRRMLGASAHFGYQLPEVFAGLPRAETPFPIAYPTAARPQAWAAGTPVLLLQVLLGLEPDRRRHELETHAPEELPSWAGRSLRLSGIRAFDRQWDVRVDQGRVTVEEV
ncbi:MAG TPA: amylo-alpha-1,6-glucosidase, partial [Gaiellaceae bacterium]|nr:amylo-alpha-1,6-glucosidase [Gaiellaceae bacterium]